MESMRVKLEKEIMHTITITLIAVLFLSLITWKLSKLISQSISYPVRQVCQTLKQVAQGNFDVHGPQNTTEELQILTNNFEHMAQKVERLIEDVKVEQQNLRKKELQLLQEQINPHFLYNTLDSIVWMITGERYREAVFMITQLGSLFRVSLSRGKTIISIEDEIRHAQNYMSIQKIRYKNAFQVEFQVEPEVQQCCTVKLVLQPLLENAIYYGMEYMDGEGEILVKGYEKDGDIYLEVQDNGLGMPEEEAAKLLTESSRERKRGSGVGLINVDSRIRLRFGKEYGLLIESHPDEGMKVTIHIPAIPYTEENQQLLEEGKYKAKEEKS